jgi:hypothetical protein
MPHRYPRVVLAMKCLFQKRNAGARAGIDRSGFTRARNKSGGIEFGFEVDREFR